MFVAGEKSHYILESDHTLIAESFPQARIITAPDAGHWVHADQPAWLLQTMQEHIKSVI
jgi:pimeloyl-ACP methyl ester carboxylesterase